MKDQMTAQQRYDKENIQFVGLRLNKKYDGDILKALDGKKKQTEIKRLIRVALSLECNNV